MKKIMFNERFGLQQSTFGGTKTMTRRIVPDKIMKDALAYQSHHIDDERAYERYILEHAPYNVGEVVAIAQSYKTLANDRNHEIRSKIMENSFKVRESFRGAGFENKMFVKAEYMPHHIKITGIRVQNLQDISYEDCLKEGVVENHKDRYNHYPYVGKTYFDYLDPREAFAALINKVSGKGTWKSNPLVYAYTYELVD